MSVSNVIELGGEMYSSRLLNKTIELQLVSDKESQGTPSTVTEFFDITVKTFLLHIHPKGPSNKGPLGIQFIKQQHIDILNRANTSNLLYFWIGFENCIDLIYFELPVAAKAIKVESIGRSALSFEFGNQQFGTLSTIQILDSVLGKSTFVGFHFIKTRKSETVVSIIPVDAYVAVFHAEKIRSRIHAVSRHADNLTESADLSTFHHLSLMLKDTSETRSLIDSRTLLHWCPHMILHSEEVGDFVDNYHMQSTSKYSWQQILSSSAFSFAAIAQTRNMTQKVMTYVSVQQMFIDTVLAYTANDNNNYDDLSIFLSAMDKVPKFFESSDSELVVHSPCSVDNEYFAALKSNPESSAWQYCLALKMIPIDRQKSLIESYFPKANIQHVNIDNVWKQLLTPANLKAMDQSFPRAVVFEALVAVNRGFMISRYIRFHDSGNGPLSLQPLSLSHTLGGGQAQHFLLQDVGRVHKWAVDYKTYLDTSVRRMTTEVFSPLLLNKALSTELLPASAGELIDVPLEPLVKLNALQTATRAIVDILKSLRKRKISTFTPTTRTNGPLAPMPATVAAGAMKGVAGEYEMDFVFEEHIAFIAEISNDILQLETMASILHFYSISCYSREVCAVVSLKPFLVSPGHEPMYPLCMHMSEKYACQSDKGYLYVTPPELVLRQTIYDLLVERVCVQVSMRTSAFMDADGDDKVKELRDYYLQRFQSPFLAQQQSQSNQEDSLSSLLLLALDISTRLKELLPSAPLVSSVAAEPSATAAWTTPNHVLINNNNDYLDISLVHSTHQLLLYTILDACYLTLEAAYCAAEMAAHSSRSTTAAPQQHTDNDDDLDGHHDNDDDHAKLHKVHKKKLLVQLTNVANTLGTAFQLNVVQINLIFSLWKLDNNVDVMFAASEMCRLVYHLEDDAQLFEVIIQRLLSINNDNCLSAVQRLVHYFVNNVKAVGRMLVDGTVTASDFTGAAANTSLDSRVGFSVLALAASHCHSISYINGWHIARRLCSDRCSYSAYDKLHVRRRVALMLCKWCALSGYLKEFLEQDMDSNEAGEVESYLEELAMRDVAAAHDPSNAVQLVCTWLTRRRLFEKAQEIHELHMVAVKQAVELKSTAGGSGSGLNTMSSEAMERQRILDAYTLIPRVSEQYFRSAEPRNAAYPSLLDRSRGLEAFVPHAVSSQGSSSTSTHSTAQDKGLSDLNVSQLPVLNPWFSKAFRAEGENVQAENNENHLMKAARKQDASL